MYTYNNSPIRSDTCFKLTESALEAEIERERQDTSLEKMFRPSDPQGNAEGGREVCEDFQSSLTSSAPGKILSPFLVHSTCTLRLQMVNYSGYS